MKIFAIDSGSPVSSIALHWEGGLLSREFSVGDSSRQLVPGLDELLAEAGQELEQLQGLAALRGPGSFTGLRVGLATVLGLHQALGVRATTVTTLEALAYQARRRARTQASRIVAAVDALRGERFAQSFDSLTLEPLSEPAIQTDRALAELTDVVVVGFALGPIRSLAEDQTGPGAQPGRSELLEAEPLAADLAHIVADLDQVWDPAGLTRPLYLRPPAATAPKTGPAANP